jgi:hypothetical protein
VVQSGVIVCTSTYTPILNFPNKVRDEASKFSFHTSIPRFWVGSPAFTGKSTILGDFYDFWDYYVIWYALSLSIFAPTILVVRSKGC